MSSFAKGLNSAFRSGTTNKLCVLNTNFRTSSVRQPSASSFNNMPSQSTLFSKSPLSTTTSSFSSLTSSSPCNRLQLWQNPSSSSSSSLASVGFVCKWVRNMSSFYMPSPPSFQSSSANNSLSFAYDGAKVRATTILCVRKDNMAVMIGDGQVSLGDMVVKPNARKIRRVSNGKVIVGCAGSVADAFTLIDRLESKLEECGGKLQRACIELAKAWRTDRYLRHLQASLIAVDREVMLHIGGAGDIMEPHDNILATGSGMYYALPAARALLENCPQMTAEDVAIKAMNIAGDMCVYTNRNFVVEKIEMNPVSSTVPLDEESIKPSKETRSENNNKKDEDDDDDEKIFDPKKKN